MRNLPLGININREMKCLMGQMIRFYVERIIYCAEENYKNEPVSESDAQLQNHHHLFNTSLDFL